MLTIEQLTLPGDHSFFFEGKAGVLEAMASIPNHPHLPYIAILGHPHSLQGGTMTNKVVTTLARTFKELEIPSLRFNFRGVGASEGVYDAGKGESEDMAALINQCQVLLPRAQFILAGFSFGSYVAYRTALLKTPCLLLSIAPPVNHYSFKALPSTIPWHLFQGEADEVVPLDAVLAFKAQVEASVGITCFAETSHFFHGKLIALREQVLKVVKERLL